jgi:hypothetical protein
MKRYEGEHDKRFDGRDKKAQYKAEIYDQMAKDLSSREVHNLEERRKRIISDYKAVARH